MPVRRDRQDRGSVRRPRHHPRASTRRATTTAWTRSKRQMDARRSRPDLRQPRRLRHAVRPPQRRRRLRREPRALRRAAGRRCCRGCAPTICWSSPPITATIRRRRAPITRASTCRCWSTGARVRAGVDLGTRATFADLGQTLAELFGVGAAARTARASCRDDRDARPAGRYERVDPRTARSSASATSSRRRRPRAPTRAGGCARKPKTTSGRRSSAIAIASSTARRSAG